MLKLIKRHKLNIEMHTVLWSGEDGQFHIMNFWSEGKAKEFIARKWPHIDLNTIEVEEV